MKEARSEVVRGGAVISAGTLATRLLGFLREILSGAYFGTGGRFDAFVVAFSVPSLFRRVLGEEMFERAFLPPFRRLVAQGRPAAARAFLGRIFLVACAAMTGVVLAVLAVLPWLVHLLAPGFDAPTLAEAIRLARLFLPFLVLIGVAAFFGSVLQFSRRMVLFSLAPAVTNLVVVIVLVLGHRRLSVTALVIGWLLGALAAILVQAPAAIRIVASLPAPAPEEPAPRIAPALLQGGNVLGASVVSKSVEVVDRVVASLLGAGAISSLYFAFRLVHLPFSVLSLALSRSLVPELSRLRGEGDSEGFGRMIAFGTSLNLLVLGPLVVLLAVLASPVVAVFYQRGAFDGRSVAETALAYQWYAPAILGMGLIALLNRVFAALEDNRAPLLAAAVGAGLNIGLDLLLYRTPLRQGGIALASSLALAVQAMVMALALRRQGVFVPWRQLIRDTVLLFPLLFWTLAVALGARNLWPWDRTFLWSLGGLALAGIVALAPLGPVLRSLWARRG